MVQPGSAIAGRAESIVPELIARLELEAERRRLLAAQPPFLALTEGKDRETKRLELLTNTIFFAPTALARPTWTV
jgi:hypothetical protein